MVLKYVCWQGQQINGTTGTVINHFVSPIYIDVLPKGQTFEQTVDIDDNVSSLSLTENYLSVIQHRK